MSVPYGDFFQPTNDASTNPPGLSSPADDEIRTEACTAAIAQLQQAGFSHARLTIPPGPCGCRGVSCGSLELPPNLENNEDDVRLVTGVNQRPLLQMHLRHAGQYVGDLAVGKSVNEPFTPEELRMVGSLAGLVSANISLATRLTCEKASTLQVSNEQRGLDEQVVFQRLLSTIAQANFDYEPQVHILQGIVEQIVSLFGPATGYISLWDSESQEARLAAGARLDAPGSKPSILLPEIQALTTIVLDSGRSLLVEDVQTQRGVANLAAHMKDVRSLLALPLCTTEPSGDRCSLGSLLMAYASSHTFHPEYITQLEQTAAALGSALYKQRALVEAQRKAQENNILQQAGELIHSSIDQEEVIAIILQQWVSLMPGKSHCVLLRRDGQVTVVAVAGETRLSDMQGQSFPVSGVNPLAVVLHSGKPLKIKHGRGQYNTLPEQIFNPNCVWLGVPLPYRGRVIGLLMVEQHKINDYTPAQVRLAGLFSRQVACALEHARLYAREQHRVRELNALQQATAALLSTLNLEELLGQILDAAIMALPGSTHGSIYLVAPQTGKLQIRAMYGAGAVRGQKITLMASEPYVIQAVKERRPLLIPYIEDTEPLVNGQLRASPQSAIVSPLLLREKVLGALFVGASHPEAFCEDNLRLVESFAATATEALQNAMLHAEVKSYAITDSLTGLYNRRGLFELGEPEVERARRFKRPLALLMFDIDNFKSINDKDGHDAGDEILREIGQRCRQFSRNMDILGRFGGDEFVVLVLEADLQAAQEIGSRLLKGISTKPIAIPNASKTVTVSMGISLVSSSATDLSSIIKAADTAMYVSKAKGGNCLSVG